MLAKSVLVKGINNLSDARYCAGMGVDYVAFELNPSDPNYLDPAKIKEIKNWLVGIEIGVRLTDCETIAIDIINELEPSFIIISEKQYDEANFDSNVFVESNSLIVLPDSVKLLWHTSKELLDKNANTLESNVYLDIEDGAEAMKNLAEGEFNVGLVLNGGSEVRPGYSDYGDLMDILELLDD